MKKEIVQRFATIAKKQAVKQSGVMCSWFLHQPRVPQAVLDLKKK